MKRKGFTLVELLAVIVILAIIALITTVVVINIVETVKIRKYKVEEKSLEKAAELYYTNSQIFPFQDEISLNTLVEKGFINSVKDTGNGSTCEGKVIKDNNGELKGCLKCSNYVTEGCGYVIEQEIKDENPGVICGNGTEEDYDKQEECHIKSVEDLVAFSYLVNSGKTFEGKTVYLDKDLDITNYAKEKSYVDPDKKVLYDINGDGEKTSLKDEMTTDKGFQPIGTSENNFKGKFKGNAYTISNLMINRPDEDNVGLFGYVTGDSDNYATIVGLNVDNINVKGKNYVGGIVGYAHSYADINEVMVSGNVSGEANNIGGIVGYIYNENYSVNVTSVISNTNVTGNAKTSNYIGGIAGYVKNFNSSTKITGIVESGTISGFRYIYAISSTSALTGTMKTAHVNKDVKVTGDAYVYDYDESKGEKYSNSEYGNLNLYNDYIDTWLGGDNDGSGYYFDYESETSNKIVLRSNSINTKFEKGSGTKENPYLIYNAEDMKKIAAMPTEQNYYKLMNDIDYNNKHYYMIGTYSSAFGGKSFAGTFEGGAHTLKNINVYGYNYIGLFGHVRGSDIIKAGIIGLNVENIKVNGNGFVGGVVGYAHSYADINEVMVSGNVSGEANNIGGIVGYIYNENYSVNVTSVISNTNVTGNAKTSNYIGGIAGYVKNFNSSTKITGIVESGTISGFRYIYAISSTSALTGTMKTAHVNKDVKVTGDAYVYDYDESKGEKYSNSEYGNLNLYNDYIDTWLGGDNDGSGYYFDYESETSNKIVLRSNSINTKFEKGSGTKENPYLIYNAEDMKKIAAMPTEQNYYKLMNDIDYNNKHYYMIGTYSSAFGGKSFAGTFEGGAHTLKNINVYGYNYIGLFGHVRGSDIIKAGIIGLNVENIKVNGNGFVGGVVGYAHSYADINEVMVSGNVLGEANNIGGIVGYAYNENNSVNVTSVISNTNVTGNEKSSNYIGGIIGYVNNLTSSTKITGIVESGTISGFRYIYAISSTSALTGTMKTAHVNKDVKVTGDAYVYDYDESKGEKYSNSEYGNLNLYNDYIDTWLGGDNDGSGYYFDYESETSNKIVLRSNSINTKFEKGSGTKENPYLIYNAEDMKKIAAMPTEQNYYKLMNDIDYNNKHYYMIGTSKNQFSGVFEGGAHTLKNIKIFGKNAIGLIGTSKNSLIQGLNVENIYVTGNTRLGSVTGQSFSGIISEINVTGTIESIQKNDSDQTFVGGIVGTTESSNSIIKNSISNMNVIGKQFVGGIVGYNAGGQVSGIVEGGTITGTSYVYAVGYKYSGTIKGFVNSKINIKLADSSTWIGGTEFSESYYNNLQYYGTLKLNSNVVVETPYSGDIDASGYYFNYNNDGTDIIVVKTNNSSQSLTTGNVVYTKTVTEGADKEAPKCTLGRYSVHGNGFTASYTCTDNTKVKARKHIYWVSEPNKVNYEDLISWPSTTDSSSETVSSVWTVESANSIGIEPPSKESCYYFYYGAQDEAGNTVIYATPNCISY